MNAPTSSPTELKPGTRLLGYEVLGLLAQGGMAEVYLARKPGEPPVVVKRIRPNLAEDPQFVGMFMDEARVAQSLAHPNVVKVLEVGKDGREYALSMEFLDGRNLLRVARACFQRRAYVPYELMARIVADTLAGLEHAHNLKGPDGKTLNLVHRDMSPENIMVTYGGAVKVVDFGIAKAANMEGRTQAGVIKGKLGYVAPEAVLQDRLDGRADIFAMGVTLYELLTYTVPFSGGNELEVLTAITQKEPQAPSAVNASVPKELEDICMKALVKDRDKRWQTAGEMRKALERYIRSTGKGTTPPYLGAFMEALFPRSTDKDRLKVAEMLATVDSAETGETEAWAAKTLEGARPGQAPQGGAEDQSTHMEEMAPEVLEELRSGLLNVGRAAQPDPPDESTSVEMSRSDVDAVLSGKQPPPRAPAQRPSPQPAASRAPAAPPARAGATAAAPARPPARTTTAPGNPAQPAAARPRTASSASMPVTPAPPAARRGPLPPPAPTREVPAAPAAPPPPADLSRDLDALPDLNELSNVSDLSDLAALKDMAPDELDVPFTDPSAAGGDGPDSFNVPTRPAATTAAPHEPTQTLHGSSSSLPVSPAPVSVPTAGLPVAPTTGVYVPEDAAEPVVTGMHPVVAMLLGMLFAAVLTAGGLVGAHYAGVITLPLPEGVTLPVMEEVGAAPGVDAVAPTAAGEDAGVAVDGGARVDAGVAAAAPSP